MIIGARARTAAEIEMCDVAGRMTSLAGGTVEIVPVAAASSSPPPRSRNIATACSGRTPSASPMMTIVLAGIDRICAAVMFWSSGPGTRILSM